MTKLSPIERLSGLAEIIEDGAKIFAEDAKSFQSDEIRHNSESLSKLFASIAHLIRDCLEDLPKPKRNNVKRKTKKA